MSPSQLLILGVPGPEVTPEDAALFRRLQPGGFILFSRNVVDAPQVRRLTDDLRDLCDIPPVLCIDNEGGRVWRTGPCAPAPPAADRFRQAGDQRLIMQAGHLTGRLLRLLGINLNLAPVLDIDRHPGASNALRGRCWGHNDQEVLTNAGLFNRYQRRQGVLGCGKHFPAGGRAVTDPHHELPVVDATIDEMLCSDLIPYTALMPELDAVMISHLHFPRIDDDGLPASLSPRLITGLLRTQLGFDHHLVLTDDLDMGAIQNHYGTPAATRAAIDAGADMVLLCHEFARAADSLAALEDLPPPRLDDSLRRIERAKARFASPLPFAVDTLDAIADDLRELDRETPGHDDPPAPTQSPVEDF